MSLKYLIAMAIAVLLFSGCAQEDDTAISEPQFRTYTIEGSPGSLDTYTVQEYEQVDLSEAFRQDRAEIESSRRYEAARSLADKEKEERERLECYKSEGKNETEYYLEECEN